MLRVYSKDNCQACKATKRWLSRKGIEFEEIDIEKDTSRVEEFKERGLYSLPIIEFGKEIVSGFHISWLERKVLS